MRNHHGYRSVVVRLLAVALVATVGLALSPATAHADSWRTATATDSGSTHTAGSANARSAAKAALTSQARHDGEPYCTNITTSATHVYTAPDGSAYVYSGTATGFCTAAPPPGFSHPVLRSATTQGGGSSPYAARNDGIIKNNAAIRAAGVDCISFSSQLGNHIYTAPDGSWYVYNVHTSALCTH